jgi:putative spermidine/putrescine transport system permease protein
MSAVRRPAAWRAALPALPLLVFLALLYAWPILSLLLTSVTDPSPGVQQYRHLIGAPVYALVFARSFMLAGIVTLFSLVIAYPVAYHLTQVGERARRWLMLLILIPSWTSVLVRSFGWMILLGRHGIVNAALRGTGLTQRPLQLMFDTQAVALAMIAILLPFAVVPLTTRMRAIDPVLMQAAKNLGAGRLDCFWRVHLPLSLPGVVAGASLVFVLSLGFFITPSLLGGTHDITAAMLIMQQFQALLNWGFGAALSAVLLLLAAMTLLLFAWAGRVAARGAEHA